MKTLSILIPVYNEEKSIDTLLGRVVTQPTAGWKKEIIVIDDGSSDTTRVKLRKWESKCQCFYQKRNRGKGSAIQAGLAHATGDIILIQDADLEYSPSDYPILLKPFENPQIMAVYGSRFLGAHLSTMFVYSLGNKFVTFMTNLLFNTNITDMETGYKVFRSGVIKGLKLTANKFDFEPEVTAKTLKAGYQIYEVPISYFGRKFSEGKKLTWRDGVAALFTLVKLRFLP